MSSSGSFSELASKISVAATAIDGYLKTHNVPPPSLKEDGPMGLPNAPEVSMAKMQLLELLTDMQILTHGPMEAISLGVQLVC